MDTNKRKVLTIKQKLNILSELESGSSNSEVCRNHKLSKSTVSTILKNKTKIRNSCNINVSKRKKIRKPVREDVDQALFKWFTIQRSQNMPVTGPILQTKAEELAKLCSNNENREFVCTKGWLDRFKTRYDITSGKIHGEAASVCMGTTTEWLTSKWPEISKGYDKNDIFNGDETGLFYKMTPDKTLKFKGEKCSGGKHSKERITIWVCANMSGTEKRNLLVIGKSKSPRCFKNCKTLPVSYVANKRAWVTSEIFESLLREWDRELEKKKRKILLIVDNCPAHPWVQNLKFIKLVFLPPNVTAVLQPMDQGVIRCIKEHYRKMLIVRLISSLESNESFKITILDAILMISASWRQVSQQTIENCFRHAGFIQTLPMFDEEDDLPLARWIELQNDEVPNNETEIVPLSAWLKENAVTLFSNETEVDEFVNIDDGLITTELPSDADLMDLSQPTTTGIIDEESAEEDNTDSQESEMPTVSKALDSLAVISTFLQCCNAESSILESVDKIYKYIEKQTCLKNKIQNKITDYFSQN